MALSFNSLARRAARRLLGIDERGVAAMEFALIAPLMLSLMFGAFQFGMTFYNFLQVGNSVAVGSRTFAMSRGASTPYTSTTSAMTSAASSLTSANLTITLSVSGTACATDTACSAALTQGSPVTVRASYPCSLVVVGVNFFPSCSLVSTTTGRVE